MGALISNDSSNLKFCFTQTVMWHIYVSFESNIFIYLQGEELPVVLWSHCLWQDGARCVCGWLSYHSGILSLLHVSARQIDLVKMMLCSWNNDFQLLLTMSQNFSWIIFLKKNPSVTARRLLLLLLLKKNQSVGIFSQSVMIYSVICL